MGKKPFTKLSYRERRLQLPNLPLAAIYSADMGEMLRGSKQAGASPSHDTMKMYDRALRKLLPEFGARTFATLLPRDVLETIPSSAKKKEVVRAMGHLVRYEERLGAATTQNGKRLPWRRGKKRFLAAPDLLSRWVAEGTARITSFFCG